MIKKIIDIFTDKNKTYDLGKLQKYGYISSLDKLSACPKCRSKNIAWKFYIPVDGSEPTKPSLSVCTICGYEDLRGGFEKTNKAKFREDKINQLLNGV